MGIYANENMPIHQLEKKRPKIQKFSEIRDRCFISIGCISSALATATIVATALQETDDHENTHDKPMENEAAPQSKTEKLNKPTPPDVVATATSRIFDALANGDLMQNETPPEQQYKFEVVDEKWLENSQLLGIADDVRQNIMKPPQSLLRSVALLVYEDLNGVRRQIVQSNWEASCFLQNSMTAVQTAFSQLLKQGKVSKVVKIIFVTDSPKRMMPGAISRELIASFCKPDTELVICGSADLTDYCVTSVAELYPHSNIFGQLGRRELVSFGHSLARKLEGPQTLDAAKTYDMARLAAERDNPEIHTLRLGAAVLFEDGTMDFAWQQKNAEYSSSLDPVSLLAMALEKKRLEGVEAKLILQRDQFGILHAPLAPARAFLVQRGYKKVKIMVHDSQGKIHEVYPHDLLPQSSKVLGETNEEVA